MELLYDWQFWGVLLTLVGIGVTIAIAVWERNKKKLVYSELVNTSLLSVSDEIRGKIKVLYGKKAIQNVQLVEIKITNKGNVPIAPSDFQEPIVFYFEDSELLNAEVTDVYPKNLKPEIKQNKSAIHLNPILLNSGEYIKLKMLFTKFSNKIEVTSRIIGIKAIERIIERQLPIVAIMVAVGSFFGLIAFVVATYLNARDVSVLFNAVIPVIATWIGTILAYYLSKSNFEAANRSVMSLATLRSVMDNKIESLVKRMLELHKLSPRTSQEKERVKHEIESTDRAIDRLVYELYGLTEDEIKIVEG